MGKGAPWGGVSPMIGKSRGKGREGNSGNQQQSRARHRLENREGMGGCPSMGIGAA